MHFLDSWISVLRSVRHAARRTQARQGAHGVAALTAGLVDSLVYGITTCPTLPSIRNQMGN